jgi:hypothetical protein
VFHSVATGGVVIFESSELIVAANDTFVASILVSFTSVASGLPVLSKNYMIFEFTSTATIKSIGEFFGTGLIVGGRCGGLPIILSPKSPSDETPDFLKAYADSVPTPLNSTVDTGFVATLAFDALSNISADSTWNQVSGVAFGSDFVLKIQQRLSGADEVTLNREEAFNELKKWFTLGSRANFNSRVSGKNDETSESIVLLTFTWSNSFVSRSFSTPVALIVKLVESKITEARAIVDAFQYEIVASGVQTPASVSCYTPAEVPKAGDAPQTSAPIANSAPQSTSAPQSSSVPQAVSAPQQNVAPQTGAPKVSTKAPSTGSALSVSFSLLLIAAMVLAAF